MNMALMSIMTEFDIDSVVAQWTVTGCMITFGPALAPVVCGGMVTVFGWHTVFVVPVVAMVILAAVAVPSVRNLDHFGSAAG